VVLGTVGGGVFMAGGYLGGRQGHVEKYGMVVI